MQFESEEDSKRKRQRKANQEACRRYYHKNLESQRTRIRIKNRKRDPLKRLEEHRKWIKEHPDRARLYAIIDTHKRRSKKKLSSVNPKSISQWLKRIHSNKTIKCYHCGTTVSTMDMHLDHIVPLSKGGAHSIENLCASCAECNLKKGTTLIQDWYKLGQQILAL